MNREELRQEFERACEIKWENSQGEPDIDYVMWLEDKITATQPSLLPAEGAEKSCLSCRFHNSPTYHDKMWCRDCQQLSHYEQQPTAEGTGKTCHAKEMEYNHNMCAMQESCEKCEAYKVPTNEGDIAKTETDTGRIVDMPSLPLPPAEGAEEIIESIVESLGEPINIHNHIFEIRPYTVEHKTEWWIFHKEVGSGEPLAQWLQNFATLHTQPTAEGAEEILLSHPYLKVMYDDTAGEVCMVEQAIWAIEKFATLHAQRIAEKKYADTEAGGYVFCGKCGKMKEI